MNYLDLELNDSNNYLSFYDDSLSIYKEYKTVRREININTLLEDKNIQFDISDMVTSKNLNGFVIKNDDHSITNNLGFIVKSMSFIIRNNKITSLKVGFETVKLFEGLMLNELINSGCLLHLKAKGENNQLDYFYITYGSSYIANSN